MRFTIHKPLLKTHLGFKLLLLTYLSFIHFCFTSPSPMASGFRSATESSTKTDFNGIWQGKALVDWGEGYKEEFDYEILITQKGRKIVGYSTTVLKIGSKKYVSKSLLDGEVRGKTIICREVRNVFEDKLPNGWVLITKMKLEHKEVHNYQTLEGLYQCVDKTGGKLILEKKPPRV